MPQIGDNTDCDVFPCSSSMIPVRVGGSFLYEKTQNFYLLTRKNGLCKNSSLIVKKREDMIYYFLVIIKLDSEE